MKIEVDGECSFLGEEQVKYAAGWLARRLLGDAADDLRVSILHKADLGVDMARMRQGASKYHIELSCRRIKTLRSFYICLAHEMVHVWQYATKAISPGEDGTTRWRAFTLKREDFGYRTPWEIEAHEMENHLYQDLKAHLNRGGSAPRVTVDFTKPALSADVIGGKKCLCVVLRRYGRVVMALPAFNSGMANEMVDRWVETGQEPVWNHLEPPPDVDI